MTAAKFAELVNARRAGAGWQAHCPAHVDRSPSLSISEGTDGRVLVRCFAGCETTAILTSLELTWSDLFAGSRPSPSRLADLKRKEEGRRQEARLENRKVGAAFESVRKWQDIADALFERLLRVQDEQADQLAKLYHRALFRMREAETNATAMEARTKIERAGR